MNNLLLLPPIAFAVVFLAVAGLAFLMSRLAATARLGSRGLGPYACGEQLSTHMIQPKYSQFFPFAFFFTILHVVALMVTTVPQTTAVSMVIAAVYVLGAIVGLTVLYSR
jgi:NADH-quinone oxidoreductase subunit A